jgi:hypothetical protein
MAGDTVQPRYDVEIELERGTNTPAVEGIVDMLAGAALGGRDVSERRLVLYLRMPADSLQQAIAAAFGLVAQFGVPAAVWGGPTAAKNSSPPAVPDFVSVTETADATGRTRQAILQQIGSGSIKAGKVGREYAIRRALVTARSTR